MLLDFAGSDECSINNSHGRLKFVADYNSHEKYNTSLVLWNPLTVKPDFDDNAFIHRKNLLESQGRVVALMFYIQR